MWCWLRALGYEIFETRHMVIHRANQQHYAQYFTKKAKKFEKDVICLKSEMQMIFVFLLFSITYNELKIIDASDFYLGKLKLTPEDIEYFSHRKNGA